MGEDSDGRKYPSCQALWDEEIGGDHAKHKQWYARAEEYWKQQAISVDGVLGGEHSH